MNIVQGPIMTASSAPAVSTHRHDRHDRDLADIVHNNLANQQDWTELRMHGGGGTNTEERHPRILLSGLPPRRMYIHPDEQIAVMRAERALGSGSGSGLGSGAGERIPQPPEYEWVLPVHLGETPTVGEFAAVFDSIDAVPRGTADGDDKNDDIETGADDDWKAWRGSRRAKRLLLAVVQDDSSVVYYFMHDGIVKPRQN